MTLLPHIGRSWKKELGLRRSGYWPDVVAYRHNGCPGRMETLTVVFARLVALPGLKYQYCAFSASLDSHRFSNIERVDHHGPVTPAADGRCQHCRPGQLRVVHDGCQAPSGLT